MVFHYYLGMTKVPTSGVPETILPAQFFTGTARSNTPERRLILGVLWDAIVQLQRAEADSIEAERWIRDELENVPIRFPYVCEVLGFERQGLARVLLELRAQSVRGLRVRAIPGSQYTVSRRGGEIGH